jgi:hypothetical protein
MLNFFYTTNLLLIILTSVYAFFIYKKNHDINFIFLIYLLLSEVITFKYGVIDKITFSLLLIYIFNIRVKIKNIFLTLNLFQKVFLLLFLIFFNFNILNEIYNTNNYLLFMFSFFYSSLVFLFLFNIYLKKNKNNFAETVLRQIVLFITFLIGYIFLKKIISQHYFDGNFNLLQGKTWHGSARIVSIIAILLLTSSIIFLKKKNQFNYLILIFSLTISFFSSFFLDSRAIFICALFFLMLNLFYIKEFNLKIILFLSLIIGQIIPIINWEIKDDTYRRSVQISNIMRNSEKQNISANTVIEINGMRITIGDIKKYCKKENFSTECVYNLFKSTNNFINITRNLEHNLNLNLFFDDNNIIPESSNFSRRAHYKAFYAYLENENMLKILIGNGFYSHKEEMSEYFKKSYIQVGVNNYDFTVDKGSRIDDEKSQFFRTNSLISMTFDVGILGIIFLLMIFFSSINQLFKDKNYLGFSTILILLSLGLIINISNSGMIFALVIMPNIFINRL